MGEDGDALVWFEVTGFEGVSLFGYLGFVIELDGFGFTAGSVNGNTVVLDLLDLHGE